MQYGVRKICISKTKHPGLYAYLDNLCRLSKLLRNAALFRLRNHFTACGKESLTANEQEVEAEIAFAVACGMKAPKTVLSYGQMDRIMRVTKNPDFFSGLPMQSAQQNLKQVRREFRSWLAALKKWKQDPSAFTGRPRMPGYTKAEHAMVKFTNQDCRISDGVMKFPLTKETIKVGDMPEDAALKEVQCKPAYGEFVVYVIFETVDAKSSSDMPYTAAIDFGVNNLAAIVTDADIPCRIYKGGAIKAANQWYNKETARLNSCLIKGKDPKIFHPGMTRRMYDVLKHRTMFIDDCLHKMSKDIVKWCIENHIGRLICGVNPLWKQNSSMGSKNNQTFVQIPFARFRQMLSYLCERNGIVYVEQEESYTSKASAVDGDALPVYNGAGNDPYVFSGARIARGLYRTRDGFCVNADLNGAANIARKADPELFTGKGLRKILSNLEVIRFSDLYKTKSNGLIPRIEAA